MTDAERQRLTELDNKISWNNQTDKGEPLTEDERKEHKRLFVKLWEEGGNNANDETDRTQGKPHNISV